MSKTILINFVEAHAVGHAIEGLRYALGHRAANPEAHLAIVLNAATATELAELCPFIDALYRVPMTGTEDAMHAALHAIPRTWDHILENPRRDVAPHRAAVPGFARYYDAAQKYFLATTHRGFVGGQRNPSGYVPHQSLRLELPADARKSASELLKGRTPRIALLPAGSSPGWFYPSVISWIEIIKALRARFSSATVCLVGKRRADERTSTEISRDDFARLKSACPEFIVLFDAPLADQLAAVEACDVFLSPHSGFGLAALSVGTPWLTIAGGRWPEYFFNGVPFYSVLPNAEKFGSYTLFEEPASVETDSDGQGRRAMAMCRARVTADLSQIVSAAERLIEGRLTYEQALVEHFARLRQHYSGFLFSLDDIHRDYC